MISSDLLNEYKIMNIHGIPKAKINLYPKDYKENNKCKIPTLSLLSVLICIYEKDTASVEPWEKKNANAYLMCVCVCVCVTTLVVSDSLQPH